MKSDLRRDGVLGLKVPIDDDATFFHAKLLDGISDGIYFVDAERKITYWNRAAERLTGYPAGEAVGRHCPDNFLEHVDAAGHALCINGCPLSSTIRDGQAREAEIFLRHKLGHRVPVSVKVAPITDQSGQVVGAVELFSDATAKKKMERRVDELESMAFRDGLTRLPNRRYTELKVKQALEEFQEFGKSFGLLMLDIDHFKQVNDLHGHDAGDAVLKIVSDTLVKSLRENDLVGRWGGEEFLVVLSNVNAQVLADLAGRCCTLVAESVVLRDQIRICVTASGGATLFKHGDSAEVAIKRADELMYVSKASGRNRITLG
jgi:diguanylate cyclase (GGDEF)-like protein/PAS domain S-box-containing protein